MTRTDRVASGDHIVIELAPPRKADRLADRGRRQGSESTWRLLAWHDPEQGTDRRPGPNRWAGAQHQSGLLLQYLLFLSSESRWDTERVNARRLELLLAEAPVTGATELKDPPARVRATGPTSDLLTNKLG